MNHLKPMKQCYRHIGQLHFLVGCQAKSTMLPIWLVGGRIVRSVTEASPYSWLTAQLMMSRSIMTPKNIIQ